MKPSISIAEMAVICRDRGFPCTEDTLRQMARQGQFAFITTATPPGKKPVFRVSHTGLLRWLDEYYPIKKG